MIITQLNGGLGNQMFQFAFLAPYLLRKQLVKLDTSFYLGNPNQHNGFELFNVFPKISLPIATNRDLPYFLEKIKNQNGEGFLYQLRENRFFITEHKKDEFTFQKGIQKLNDVYFQGYWQHTKYFERYRKNILTFFTFRDLDDVENISLMHQMQQTNSVSIHIRRGDYLHSPFHEILDGHYYEKAIDLIAKKLNNPFFFVFSDDLAWAKENLSIDNAVFIDGNKGKDSFRDMQLMTLCKHNIIANSTFSWWGAYLNNKENKMVISPKKWFKDDIAMDGIILKNWTTI